MSNQAKLRVIFDRYNISPKATKNFINYFMNHAKLRIGADINENAEVIEKTFTECNSHEDGNYKFIISSTDLVVPTNDDGDNNEIIVGDACIVSGTMSNSLTEKSVEFNNDIFKLDKVDDNYELNIKSKQEFDTFNLTVKLVPKHNETYAAIVQDNYSHTAGYNFQIPIQTNDNYKLGSDKLWHAPVNREYAIGMNFCKVLIGNREDDEVKLKLIKDPAKAYYSVASGEQGYFTVHAVVDGAAGDRYKLSLSQLIDTDTSVITGVRVEIFEDNNIIFANNIIKTPHKDKVIIPVSDFESLKDETDSNKNFTDYLTPSGSKVIVSDTGLELQLVYDDITKVIFEIYLNNKLYARSFATQITRLTDESWPANILMNTFNQTNKGIRMIRFDDNGDVISNNTYFGEYINMYNYSGEAAYLRLNLNDVDDVEITMQPATDYLLTHNKESALAAQLSNKEISSKLLAFKTAYEYDRGHRCMNTADSNFNIPVSLKVVSTSGNPLDKDTFPYSNFIDEYDKESPFINLKLPKSKDKVEYSLKTQAFTMNIQNKKSGETEIFDAYYKFGVCALDGLDSSSEKLLNSFIKKSYLTVHQTDYAINEKYMYYTFAIKPKLEYMNEQKFYSVSEKFQFLDRASTITDRNNLICSTALRPIVEINTADQSKNRLLGVLYMDMFKADNDSIIEREWNKNDYKIVIKINGESDLDQEIEITKI